MRGTILKTLLKVLVSTVLLAVLLKKISVHSVIELVLASNRTMLAAAMAVFFASNLVGSFQWHLLLKSSGVAFRFYFVGLFFNNFLPANIGGDAVKVYDVSRVGTNVYHVIGVTVLDRLIGIFSLCLLACASVIYLMQTTNIESLGLYLLIFTACLAPPLAFYCVEPLSRMIRSVVSRLTPMSMNRRGASILDVMGSFKAKRVFVSRVVILALGVQAMRVLTHVLVGVALGIHLDAVVFSLFFVFVPLLSLAMIPPITINGLGIREGLGIILFSQAGIGRTDAFTLEFVTYLISVVVSLIGLVVFLLRRSAASGTDPGRDPTPGAAIEPLDIE
jgi:uncharacterized protein (TIRG00374 family)